MTRENQGLQVALIVFVMLTIVLGVTGLVFFNQCDDARRGQENALREAEQYRAAARSLQEESEQLREVIGGSPTEKLASIQQRFARDVQAHAASYPRENCHYRNIVQYLADTLRARNSELAAVRAENLDWKAKYEGQEAVRRRAAARYRQAAAQAHDELLTLHRITREHDTQAVRQREDLAAQLAEARKGAHHTAADLEARIDSLNERYVRLMQALAELKRLYDAEKDPFVSPDGRIRKVNQRARTGRSASAWPA